jgi:hypothetical protein
MFVICRQENWIFISNCPISFTARHFCHAAIFDQARETLCYWCATWPPYYCHLWSFNRTKFKMAARAQSVRRYANISRVLGCSSLPPHPPVIRMNSHKQFCNLISCTAEILTPTPFFFGTVFNITSPTPFGRDLREVLLNLVPLQKTE